MKVFCNKFVFISCLICVFAIYTSSKIVYLDNFNGRPGSFSLPPDGVEWDYLFGLPTNQGEVLDNTGSKVEVKSEIGKEGYRQGGFLTGINQIPLALINTKTFGNPIVLEEGETVSTTWLLKVSTFSRFNPLSDFMDDYDIRRGGMNIALVDSNFIQTICFLVSGTEIWIINDSLAANFGVANYDQWTSMKKVADKNQDDLLELKSEYDSGSKEMRWYVDDILVHTHSQIGEPAFDVVAKPATLDKIPFPAEVELNGFWHGVENLILLQATQPDTTHGIVDNVGPVDYPTSFNVTTYDCFDSNGVLVPIDVPGVCPLLDGYDITTTFYKIKMEVY